MSSFRDELVGLLPRLRRFARMVAGASQDADDLLHAALERALRHEADWRTGTRMDSWMFKIIRNLWVDELRSKRRLSVSLEDAGELPGAGGSDAAERQLELTRVRHAMQALPEDQRTVMFLVVVEGQSYRQAAETLEIPIGTVMSRLARARAALSGSIASKRPTMSVIRS